MKINQIMAYLLEIAIFLFSFPVLSFATETPFAGESEVSIYKETPEINSVSDIELGTHHFNKLGETITNSEAWEIIIGDWRSNSDGRWELAVRTDATINSQGQSINQSLDYQLDAKHLKATYSTDNLNWQPIEMAYLGNYSETNHSYQFVDIVKCVPPLVEDKLDLGNYYAKSASYRLTFPKDSVRLTLAKNLNADSYRIRHYWQLADTVNN